MAWCRGYPEAWGAALTTGVEDEDAAALASGSGFRAVSGGGVSTNMMDGPAVSSGATAVRGVGLEVNFGRDWWRMGGGRGSVVALLDDSASDVEVVRRAVSEVVASGWGFSGVTDEAVGRCS